VDHRTSMMFPSVMALLDEAVRVRKESSHE
jgi:hypothetical protein